MLDKGENDPFFTLINERFPYHQVYFSLDLDEKLIRLITLAPGSGGDPVECEVFQSSLSHSQPYEAMSYCAGDHNDCGQVLLNEYRFNVFRSLHTAFQHLRQPTGCRIMWIDQICSFPIEPL